MTDGICRLTFWRQFWTIFFLFTLGCTALAGMASPDERLEVFDEVWQTIQERYYDANLRGVDWAGQRNIYRQRAANAASEAEFYGVLREMVGVLRDSHTRVFSPEEKSDWRSPRFISVGLTVREVENELVVIAVEKDSAAERAGARAGDVVSSLDSVAANVIFARRIASQTGSSTRGAARLRAAAGIFEGANNSTVRVGLRDANGRERIVNLVRAWKQLPPSIRVKREGATLILGFDSFAPEVVREFFQLLQTNLRGVRGIVLDLRSNRGGSTEAMTDIASAFLPENSDIGKFIDRQGKTAVEARTRRWLLYTANAVKVQNLPVVVLTSTATASAAEIFTAALRDANRAKIVGAATCGCVLAIRRQHTLPDGGVLEISELDFHKPNGTRLEGAGIAPDILTTLTQSDIRNKRDRILEKAIETLNG